MKCPLSITGELTLDKEFIGAAADCLKEECAWWSEGKQHCAVFHIGASLYAIGEMLEGIKEKMPHEEQFRR